MRALSSPHHMSPVLPSATSPAISTAGGPRSTKSPVTSTPCASNPEIPLTTSDSTSSPPAPVVSSRTARFPDTPDQQLHLENELLKEEVARLKNQLQCVLDHTIESDTRLLQFTDQIFVTTTSQQVTASRVGPKEDQSVCTSPSVDCAVQCKMTELEDRARAEDLQLIHSLRTTVEVLEEEVKALSQELQSTVTQCGCRKNTSPWTLVVNKRKTAPSTKKSSSSNQNSISNGEVHKIAAKEYGPKKARNESKPQNLEYTKRPIPFKTVVIQGDSHTRHIDGLVRELVFPQTDVRGICLPGAKLKKVIASTPPLGARDGSRCDVIIAGTNDLSAGEEYNIFRHLEERITARPANTKLVVSTLPRRHDLPFHHPVNERIILVNNYIDELAIRHNIPVLNFNRIGRRFFTRHGLHLTMRGKRRLAGLLVGSLSKFVTVGHRPTLLPSENMEQPRTLPYDTFADPVKIPASMRQSPRRTPPPPTTLPHDTFKDAVINGPKQQLPLPTTLVNNGPNKLSFLGTPQVVNGVD